MKKLYFVIFLIGCILFSGCRDNSVKKDLQEHGDGAEEIAENTEVPEFDTVNQSETLVLAPREQNFPYKFVYDGEMVTVNEPVFTGLPTSAVLSYKNYYAFEGGATVFNCFVNGENRYVLVDKSGKILDTDYSRHITVPDYKNISYYDETHSVTLKSLETDDTWRVCLQDPQGKILSEPFDCISYAFNGISVVHLDEKIGFIDSKGNTLLKPCIEYDRLFYPPNREGFWVRYMTEDAFVLPIDGEFAIITLTRTPV